MKKASIIALTIVSAVVFIALASVSLYRYFVDSRIQDGSRMENPDTYRAGKDLVEFEWRQNHRNFYSCFSLKFYREKDMPLLTGRFPGPIRRRDERKRNGCVFQPNPLAALRGCNGLNFRICWQSRICPRTESRLRGSDATGNREEGPTEPKSGSFGAPDDGNEIQKLSGSHAEALETLVLRIAEEAYATSNLETE